MATAPDPQFGLRLPPQRTGPLAILGHAPEPLERVSDRPAACSCGWRDDSGDTPTPVHAWVLHVTDVAHEMAHRDPAVRESLIAARDAMLDRGDGPTDDPAELVRRIKQLRS